MMSMPRGLLICKQKERRSRRTAPTFLTRYARLLRIKAVLSAVFTHALQKGVLDGTNPVRVVSVLEKPVKFKGHAYSLSAIEGMLISTEGVARVVIAVAALTGLRFSELRG